MIEVTGTPEEIIREGKGHTAHYLKEYVKNSYESYP
jgi:excinuclease UvrABC ATPase subunit